MALPQEKNCTIEDILALPENVRAELIDGQIYYQAAPVSYTHLDVYKRQVLLGYEVPDFQIQLFLEKSRG